jgi:peptidyl-tRNA hydrolase
MYYVVRKDAPLSLELAMAYAGAGAVKCADRFRRTDRWAPFFHSWSARPRKVALRATAEEIAHLRDTVDCVSVADVLITLPPCLRSDWAKLVGELRPYTDGPRPKEPEPPPLGFPMTYVTRPGVLRTAGKAMAQAGHAALMCADAFGSRFPKSFLEWRHRDYPGRVVEVSDDVWPELSTQGVVVADAGLTQVEPGTETVIALPPRP